MKSSIGNRQMRLFVSSTFQDLAQERSYLVRKVFPKLRQMAEERNVILVVVDLRWGITEEEGRTGKVLETCLGEIDNCTPYFIGISGSRYGWRPTIEELSRNPRLLQQYPWLEDDIRSGKSITEIEMLYGVLRRQGHVDASFFLKKSNHDEPDIITLKQTIRRYSPDYSFEFSSLDELGNLVEKEFLRILDSHYEKRPLLPHERMKLAQQAFLESKRTIYVPHEEDFDVLTSIADQPKNEGHVVDHQMGIANDDTNKGGCSSFLSNWISYYKGNTRIVFYSIEASIEGNGIDTMLRYLIEEISNACHVELSVNTTNLPLKTQFLELLRQIKDLQPVMIIIDGLNHLGGKGIERVLLDWMPQVSGNVMMVYSTDRDDVSYNVLDNSPIPVWSLYPSNEEHVQEIITKHLAFYGKKLTNEQVQSIATWHLSRDMRVLRLLLDELVSFGSFEELPNYLNEFLEAFTIYDFLEKVVKRYSQDFGQDFVESILTTLYCSYRGLSESEIMDITESNQLQWSQFYFGFAHFLVEKDGLIKLVPQMSDYVISSIDLDKIRNASELIIRYFNGKEDFHAVTELVRQCIRCEKNDRLYHLISSSRLFSMLYKQDPLILTDSWLSILKKKKPFISRFFNNQFKPLLKYEGEDDSSSMGQYYYQVADFIEGVTGNVKESLPFYREAERYFTDDETMGLLALKRGDFQAAKEHFSKSLALSDKLSGLLGDSVYEAGAESYMNLMRAYAGLHDVVRARKSVEKAMSVYRRIEGDKSRSLVECLFSLAALDLYESKTDKAIEELESALEIELVLPDMVTIHAIRCWQLLALAYKKKGDADMENMYRQKAEDGSQKLFGRAKL